MLLRRTSAQLQRLSSARASCTAPVATPTRLPAVPRRCPSSTRAIVTAPFGYAHPARYAADREAGQNFATEHGWHGLHEQSVSWGEVDRFQHLNNVHTLKYFENGRMAFLMELLPELDEGGPATQASIVTGAPGVGIILSKVEARYRRPVTYPDTLLVAHRTSSISKDRFSLESVCWSFEQRAVVTKGSVEMVMYDHGALRKCEIPADFLAALVKRQSPL